MAQASRRDASACHACHARGREESCDAPPARQRAVTDRKGTHRMPIESLGHVVFQARSGSITTLHEDDCYRSRRLVRLGDTRHPAASLRAMT
jgi:hypothetical protein